MGLRGIEFEITLKRLTLIFMDGTGDKSTLDAMSRFHEVQCEMDWKIMALR